MTAVLAREAFGAEFVGADGFLNSPTYGLPPQLPDRRAAGLHRPMAGGDDGSPVVRRTTCAPAGPAMPR